VEIPLSQADMAVSSRNKWLARSLAFCFILGIGGGILLARQKSDSVKLELLVVEAKKHGLPMEAKELADLDPVPNAENSYELVLKLMKDFPNLSPINEDVTNFNVSNAKPKSPLTANFITRCKEIAKFKRFDAHKDYDLGVSLLYPEYSYFRRAGTVLAMQAELDTEHGNIKGAIQNLNDVRALTNQMSREKVLIGGLVNLSMQVTYFRSVGNIVNRVGTNPVALRELRQNLDIRLEEPSVGTMLKGEFFYGVTFCRNFELFGGQKALKEEGYDPGEVDPKKLVRTGLPKAAEPRGLLASYIANTLHVQQIFETESNKVVAASKADAYIDSLPKKDSNSFTRLISPIWGGTGFGLEMPKLRRVILLKSIDLLLDHQGKEFPKTIPDIPDPIVGGSVTYMRTAKGFMLYSFGKNKKDEGGPRNKTVRMESDDFGFEYEG
jgi:hypothetical protein